MSLIRSKKRVADHGEVFTPGWMVEAMLDLVAGEAERIDSRFLEPACGSGNFLVPVLQRKMVAVEVKYARSDFDKRQYALLGLMCTYGIELLVDNIAECKANMLEVLASYLSLSPEDDLSRAAAHVLSVNLVHGDALTMQKTDGAPISFSEWGYIGKGKFQRRDFRLDVLMGASAHCSRRLIMAYTTRTNPTQEWPLKRGPATTGKPGLVHSGKLGVVQADILKEARRLCKLHGFTHKPAQSVSRCWAQTKTAVNLLG